MKGPKKIHDSNSNNEANNGERTSNKRPRVGQEDYSLKALCETLRDLCSSNAKAFQEADTDALNNNYKSFEQLTVSDKWCHEDWQQAVQDISQWATYPYSFSPMHGPSQTKPNQIIGGHLFYPPDTRNLLQSSYTANRLRRRDYLHGFTIATLYHHPAAKYYLTHVLHELQARYLTHTSETIDFFKENYRNALNKLMQCKDHAEARYALGQAYSFEAPKGAIYATDLNKALKYLRKIKDVHNNYQALLLQLTFKAAFTEPTIDDFDDFALKENYGAAWVKAAELARNERKTQEAQLEYLSKAAQKLKFYPAYIAIGCIYVSQNNAESALKSFEEAGRQVPYGYILCSALIANHLNNVVSFIPEETIENLSKEKKRKIIDYYEKAGELGEAEGWYLLAGFYLHSARLIPNDTVAIDKLNEKAFTSLLKAIKLGYPKAYNNLEHGKFQSKFVEIVNDEGLPPYHNKYYESLKHQLR